MTALPSWVQRVNALAGGTEHRWCSLCGIPEAHPVHDGRRLVSGVALADVADAPEAEQLGVSQLPTHIFIDGADGTSDGRSPTPGDIRWPGWEVWEVLGGFGDLPRLEGYRQQRSPADGFAILWREPRSCRWRWGRCNSSDLTWSARSAKWAHVALRSVREEFPEMFPRPGGS